MQAKLTKIPQSYVNIRAYPISSANDIGDLYLGNIVEYLGESNGWAHIKYNGLEGYVSLQSGAVVFTPLEQSKSKIVDVSEWNGDILWKEVKAAGVEVAIIRSTIGYSGLDLKANVNLSGAINAGLQVSQYHFFKSDSNPSVQAQRFDSALKNYPVWVTGAVDVEANDGKVSPTTYANMLMEFCLKFRELRGDYPMIYTGAWFWNPSVGSHFDTEFNKMLLWVATYEPDPILPRGWKNYFLWQYTSDGKVSGFNGRVDLNRIP